MLELEFDINKIKKLSEMRVGHFEDKIEQLQLVEM